MLSSRSGPESPGPEVVEERCGGGAAPRSSPRATSSGGALDVDPLEVADLLGIGRVADMLGVAPQVDVDPVAVGSVGSAGGRLGARAGGPAGPRPRPGRRAGQVAPASTG